MEYDGEKGRTLSPGEGSPLRCGPDAAVSVDHGSKLPERIEADEFTGLDKRGPEQPIPAFH